MKTYLLNLILVGMMGVACAAKKDAKPAPIEMYETAVPSGTYDQATGEVTWNDGADGKKTAEWLAKQLHALSIEHTQMVNNCRAQIQQLVSQQPGEHSAVAKKRAKRNDKKSDKKTAKK
jgi:hypothetical protein